MDEKKYNEQFAAFDGKIKRLENELKKVSKAEDNDETLEQLDLLVSTIERQEAVLTEFDPELFEAIIEKVIIADKSIEFQLISGLKL